MAKSAAKEHILLAVMAGRSSAQDAAAARVGAEIENTARATRISPPPRAPEDANQGLLDRIKAAIAA